MSCPVPIMISELLIIEIFVIESNSEWCSWIFVNVPILKFFVNIFFKSLILICPLVNYKRSTIISRDHINRRLIRRLGVTKANFGSLFPDNLSEGSSHSKSLITFLQIWVFPAVLSSFKVILYKIIPWLRLLGIKVSCKFFLFFLSELHFGY